MAFSSIMHIEVISLSELQTDTSGRLAKCCDSGQPVVVELPDHRLVAIQPLESADEDDSLVNDLIATNPAFHDLLKRSADSRRKPFPATT